MKPSKQLNNIKVFIRNRPLLDSQMDGPLCVNIIDDKQLMISTTHSKQSHDKQKMSYTFDKIFTQEASQQEVYEDVSANIIDNIFQGINGTIFCYGQTSSGKTYTCLGNNLQKQESRGILPRFVDDILERIEMAPKHLQCKMKMSIVEIYNEKIRDLLDNSKNNLKIRQNKSQGIFIDPITEKYIINSEDSSTYITKGIENRAVGATNMNLYSSRSHMMITLTVHQHNLYTGEAKASKLILVDLAGCQKISRTGVEGKLLQQAKKINTSLSVLGKVIKILSEGKKSHIPYRDSKLTRLLQESLGGNCITNLIINISPASVNQSETVLSLRFGSRAKAIKNTPKINKQYTVPELQELLSKAEKKIKEQTEIIAELLKGNDGIFKNSMFEKFLKNYEEDRQRQKALKDFQSEMGSEDGFKKIIKCNSNVHDNYLFKEISDCFDQSEFDEQEDFHENFEKTKGKQHTQSAHKLFSSTQFLPAQIKKSASTLQVNKSFDFKKHGNRSSRSSRDNLEVEENPRTPSSALFHYKEKPFVIPKFTQMLEDESENEEPELNKANKDQEVNQLQIKISNIEGKSSKNNSKNVSFIQHNESELSNFIQQQRNQRLSIYQKVVEVAVERQYTQHIAIEQKDKTTSDKTGHENSRDMSHDDGNPENPCVLDKNGAESKVKNQRSLSNALENLAKIKQNMNKLASFRNKSMIRITS